MAIISNCDAGCGNTASIDDATKWVHVQLPIEAVDPGVNLMEAIRKARSGNYEEKMYCSTICAGMGLLGASMGVVGSEG